ncbi:MAG: TIGR02172 family protein [Bacilli bacterium]|nr:TIGR02172 family protein [Bacilli bacterium]
MNNLRKINLDDWILFGGGATSDTYYHKNDDKVMLKVFLPTVDRSAPIREFELTDKVYKLGVKTPRAIEMVEANGRIGIIYERITGKVSCARMMADHPELIPQVAKEYVREVKILHSTKCDTNAFEHKKDIARKQVINAKSVNDEQKGRLLRFIDSIPDADTCLHCDLQMGNLIKAHDEYYWIDLGDFAYGYPLFDIASVMFAADTLAHTEKTQELYHMNTEQLRLFWKCFLKEYLESDDEIKTRRFIESLQGYLAIYYLFVVEVNNFIPGGEEIYQKIINSVK